MTSSYLIHHIKSEQISQRIKVHFPFFWPNIWSNGEVEISC